MRIPIQVLVYPVRYTDRGWEYLLLKRIPSRGGVWQGVTGGLEEGELLHDAARRELYEETGFAPLKIEKIDLSYSFPVADEWRHSYSVDVDEITEYVFVAFLDTGEPVLDPQEHNQYKWCSIDEALQLLYWPNNKKALKQVHDIVVKKGLNG
ncbi:MAG: NUDIX pyrophosphatase [Theionarchaea archaeon]|nr:NUDIX pyrophosphatase [Theionarchaea archaeon]